MTYLHIHLEVNTSFHPIHNHRKFSLNFLHSFFVLIPQKLVDSNFSFFFVRTSSSPGILALPLLSSSPDISLQTKAKRLDTTNVFRNLLNGARINEIKKERKKRKKEIKKAQGGSQRTEETKLLLLPPPFLSFRVSRYYRWSHVGAQRPIIVFPSSSRDEKTSSWMILNPRWIYEVNCPG